ERRLVTMMFVDISGFTALSEKFDPEYVRNLTNACFDHLLPVIQKYQGIVERFIGDAIMALFGAPIAHENDPERALRAALDLMDAMAAFNRQQNAELQLHIGVNTGLVVAGGLGARGRQMYSVMGDAANLASRLEDAAETGEILVGPETYRLTAMLFDFEPLPPIRVKGKAEPVAPYRLLGRKATPGSERGIEGLSSPLLGRDAELAGLRRAFDALQHGRGQIVAITGEAGLGKTRLVAEARGELPAGTTWVECHGLPHTEDISYWTARELLGRLAGVMGDTPPREVGHALYTSVERLFPRQLATVYPYLARLFDVPLPEALEEEVRYLGAEALHGRIHQAVSRFVRAHALAQPLALVWDDLHWADPSSLKVLDMLLPLSAEAPLLLVLVFRADEPRVARFLHTSARTYEERYHVIELGPLDHADSAWLLNSLLQIEHWPDETLNRILDKAEGNPFYLEEILRTLIDAGVVVLQDNRAVMVRAADALHVPDTLQGVIMARIDRLAAVDRRVLQTAAVIGRVFSYQVLARLL
ncbi:MAG TPA: adenylate/guanylate cyclase domain-containing protein, partial [Herpetosiphonaceae bacterium]|nr:adenylate/guanylate cyclase domain-containing protein [Herpetosiphonaceae bacterium]